MAFKLRQILSIDSEGLLLLHFAVRGGTAVTDLPHGPETLPRGVENCDTVFYTEQGTAGRPQKQRKSFACYTLPATWQSALSQRFRSGSLPDYWYQRRHALPQANPTASSLLLTAAPHNTWNFPTCACSRQKLTQHGLFLLFHLPIWNSMTFARCCAVLPEKRLTSSLILLGSTRYTLDMGHWRKSLAAAKYSATQGIRRRLRGSYLCRAGRRPAALTSQVALRSTPYGDQYIWLASDLPGAADLTVLLDDQHRREKEKMIRQWYYDTGSALRLRRDLSASARRAKGSGEIGTPALFLMAAAGRHHLP